MYELKKKFCYSIKKCSQKSKVERELLAFVEERFNGFVIVTKLMEGEKKESIQAYISCLQGYK